MLHYHRQTASTCQTVGIITYLARQIPMRATILRSTCGSIGILRSPAYRHVLIIKRRSIRQSGRLGER